MCKSLWAMHAAHMSCRAGCQHCCMEFSIFPVEFHAILHEAGAKLQPGNQDLPGGSCPFLANQQCLIYQSRPFICRTQGFPLLYLNDEQWELSVCELNFTRFEMEDFDQQNTFPQDTFNSRLYMINQQFIEIPGQTFYRPGQLIPLSRLMHMPEK